ncbi:enoyl-CoA hydratase-related protein [Streptomyces californicus]|uniref:enoyl-CoA hydratase-related protein n=1 Tax=Streptomyces californicus TaxID=67351 RepID=UPI0036CBB5E8
MNDHPLHLDVRNDGLALLTIHGSGTGNALGGSFWDGLRDTMQDLSTRRDVRTIAVTGAGSSFSVGMDLRWYIVRLRRAMRSQATGFMEEDVRRLQNAIDTVADCPKPVIALVNGECTGAALELISACDIRYATGEAFFALPEVQLGVVADLGGLQRLPQLINQGHLRELAFSGRALNAERAARIGLVNEVFPDATALLQAAENFNRTVSRHPEHVLEGIKQNLDDVHRTALTRGLDHAVRWNSHHIQTPELAHAMAARLHQATATAHREPAAGPSV